MAASPEAQFGLSTFNRQNEFHDIKSANGCLRGGIGPLQPFFFQQLQALVEQEEREKAKGHTVIL